MRCTYKAEDNYTFSKTNQKKVCTKRFKMYNTQRARLICINYIFKKKNKVTRAKQLNTKLANMKAKPRKNNYYK